jgi:hypothetical protein
VVSCFLQLSAGCLGLNSDPEDVGSTFSPESVNYKTTRIHMSQDRTLHSGRHENKRPSYFSQTYIHTSTIILCCPLVQRGPLSLVSTTEELLDRKVAAPV